MLEIEREKPGQGPEGQKGQALAVAGRAWMSMREIAEMKLAGQSLGRVREGRS